jgi:hypothetical protein
MADEQRDRDDERPGQGPGPESDPHEAGPPLTEEGTSTGTTGGEHAHEPEPAAGGTDEVPQREQGGL